MNFRQSFLYQLYYHELFYDAQYYHEWCKPYVPDYDGNVAPKIFLDQVNTLEELFALHNFINDRCMHYASMKLVRFVTIY